MKKIIKNISAALLVSSSLLAASVSFAEESMAEKGNKVAFDRKKGNCLACHMIPGGELAGNIGPALVAMKARFPDASVLRAKIYDPRVSNPNSSMPPFGAHNIISDEEIDQIVEFLYTK